MRYHGNWFFFKFNFCYFAILVKDLSFFLVKIDSQYHKNNQRDIVFYVTETIFSIFKNIQQNNIMM